MSNSGYSRVLTIASLERMRLSAMGNPRFRVTFTDGSVAQTQTDGSVGYSIENSEYRDVPVVVHFTRAGRIWNVEVADQTMEQDPKLVQHTKDVLDVVMDMVKEFIREEPTADGKLALGYLQVALLQLKNQEH